MKKTLTFLLIGLLVIAVSACSGEETPGTTSEAEQIIFVKMVNNSGENIALDCSCDWDEDYLSGSYYLDLEDFKIAPGQSDSPTRYEASQLDNFKDMGNGSFEGAVLGIAAPITKDDIDLDSSSSMITVAQLVPVEASYGDMVLLKWNGAGFDVEVGEWDGSESLEELVDDE